jgi:GNAT superfamily N-acetyltransferase
VKGTVEIVRVGSESADVIFDLVQGLLRELGEESDDLGDLDRNRVLAAWRDREPWYRVLLGRDEDGQGVGLLTLTESFAIYANGPYGVIDEMWVAPSCRSRGLGRDLLNAAKSLGRDLGWSRIDVTAPESPRWARTRAFYEREGFSFTGPKLKFRLAPGEP